MIERSFKLLNECRDISQLKSPDDEKVIFSSDLFPVQLEVDQERIILLLPFHYNHMFLYT